MGDENMDKGMEMQRHDLIVIGSASSIARSRAWARCCGGPHRPNQASLEGLNRKTGRCVSSTTWPEKMIW